MQTIGKTLVSHWYDFQQLALLHNLAKNLPTYKDSRKWADIHRYAPQDSRQISNFFVGSRPRDADHTKRVVGVKFPPQKHIAFAFSSKVTFLKAKLLKEEPVILFNYFGMHKRSLELLRILRTDEHQRSSGFRAGEYV